MAYMTVPCGQLGGQVSVLTVKKLGRRFTLKSDRLDKREYSSTAFTYASKPASMPIWSGGNTVSLSEESIFAPSGLPTSGIPSPA